MAMLKEIPVWTATDADGTEYKIAAETMALASIVAEQASEMWGSDDITNIKRTGYVLTDPEDRYKKRDTPTPDCNCPRNAVEPHPMDMNHTMNLGQYLNPETKRGPSGNPPDHQTPRN